MNEHYLAIKKNDVLIHVTTWNKLGNMLSARNQPQKTAYYMYYIISYKMSRTGKSIDTESRSLFRLLG